MPADVADRLSEDLTDRGFSGRGSYSRGLAQSDYEARAKGAGLD